MSVLLQRFVQASYELDHPPTSIGDWNLTNLWTKTMKTYMKKSSRIAIFCVRGTKEAMDWETNFRIPWNGTEFGQRFATDLEYVKKMREVYPDYTFYATGHSLGGAIIDEFLERGLVVSATTFNPAVSPKNYSSGLPNRRIYYLGDPLLTSMGQFVISPPIEVYSASSGQWLSRIIGVIGRLGTESLPYVVASEIKQSHKHEHLAEAGGDIKDLVRT